MHSARFTTRPHSTKLVALLAMGLVTTLLLSACDSMGTKYHERRSMKVPHQTSTPLEVQNANGWVDAIQKDRSDVSIEVELYGSNRERLQFATVHADRMGDNTLRVWVEWPGGSRKQSEGSSIAIEIPNASKVDAKTSNGHLTIDGLSGHANLVTSNGAIHAYRHDGSIYAHTSNGSLRAEQVSGDIEMFSSNGPVSITDAFGPIRAETSNANVYVSTMDGNQGPIRILSSNGRIDLDLGEGFEGILKCDTSNGKVQVVGLDNARLVESSGRSIELRVGESQEISAVKTSNGSVRVRGRQAEPSSRP